MLGVRIVTARFVAGVGSFFFAVLFFGLIDLSTVLLQDPDWRESYLLEAGWGALFTLLVAVPLGVLTARPGRGILLAQLVAVSVAIAAATLWAGYAPQLAPATGVVVLAAVIGQLAGHRFRGPQLDRALRWLTVLGAFGGGAFATRVLAEYPALEPDTTWGLDHHPMQAAVGLAVATVGAVAAAGVGGRTPGWRVPVWTVALAAVWIGGWSIVYPDLPGSAGTALGAGAVAWGAAFAGTAEWRVRRTLPAAERAATGH
jgi:hypothetical protein